MKLIMLYDKALSQSHISLSHIEHVIICNSLPDSICRRITVRLYVVKQACSSPRYFMYRAIFVSTKANTYEFEGEVEGEVSPKNTGNK